jgi:uncharacterized repeat protein (TIGR03803 family)
MRIHKPACFTLVTGAAIILLLAMVRPLRAADVLPQILDRSTRAVTLAPNTGPLDPHYPYILRSRLRPDEAGATLEFEVVLKMRNFSELHDRIGRRERIPFKEMAAKYDPLESDYQKVVDWLTSQGFEITRQSKSHLAVFARGKIGHISSAFHTNFARVTFEGGEYSSAVRPPSVPSSLAPLLVGINGLQPHLRMQKNLQLRPNNFNSPYPPYLPSQIANAYNATGLYQSSITGTGQAIAIVIDTFPSLSDLQQFWTTYNINQNLNNISLIQVIPGTLPAKSGEETLDTEWSSALAPGAAVRVYATQTLDFDNLDQAYQQIYEDATSTPGLNIGQMSMSYGLGEIFTAPSQMDTDSQYYAQLVSAGITIFCSSGDAGATPDVTGHAGGGPLQVEIPASDPHVTSVGGTTLTLGLNDTVSSEVTWNNLSGATGGGVSEYFARPAWQTGSSVPAGSMRLVPDIACTADPYAGGILILNGTQLVVGGTSWSSPCWAAFNALFNQSRANVGLPPIGLLTPYLYPLLGTSNFRDITAGNNNFGGGTGYNAAAGYDLTTGLGVPNVQMLAQTLITPSGSPVFSSGSPPLVAALNIAYSFTFTAFARPTATYSIVSGNLPTGLSLSSSGVLSGTPSALGVYTATVQAANSVGTATETFTITVLNPSAPAITNGPPPATALFNNYYSFTYTATGSPAPAFAVASGNLPPGLALTTGGVLSGVPTGTGIYTGTVKAGNGIGSAATQSFSITVDRPPYFLSGPVSATTTVNTSFSPVGFAVAGYPASTFSVTQGSLPPGITLGASNGIFSGISTQTGTYTGTVTASNGISPNASQTFTIKVIPLNAPTFVQPSLSLVTTLSSTLDFTENVSSNPASTFNLTSGSLPPGLSLSHSGVISGTTSQIGIFSGTITAQNGISPNASQSFTVTVLNNFVRQYSTLHNFSGGGSPPDGKEPWNAMVQTPDGNIYGTALFTGSNETGVVFQLTPQGTYSIIHSFQDGSVANDGRGPQGGLIVGSDGYLYGTTVYGGMYNGGTVFKMTTAGVETILYHFGGQTNDGLYPVAALVQGSDGTLYGTTDYGGVSGDGTVFKVTLQGQETILHSFSNSPDGRLAAYSVVIGPDENIYGTTPLGGTASGGILFRITPQGAYTILHQFGDGTVANDGTSPNALTVGVDGNLYGTTFTGGTSIYYGTAYRMTLNGTETILHNFWDGSTANDADGLNAGLFQADDGNFYGVSYNSEAPQNAGTVFRMTPQGAVTILYVFGVAPDGQNPNGSLLKAADGALYGTALNGGAYSGGTIFKLSLISPPSITSAASSVFIPATSNTFPVTASGSPVFSATGLPSWATLNSSTGVLSGIPPLNSATSFAVTLTATNGVGPDATQAFTLNVQQAPVITNAPLTITLTPGTTYSFLYQASGYPPPTFTLTPGSGSFPPGMTLASDGTLTGSSSQPGTYSGTVTASNGVGTPSVQSFTITIESSTDTPVLPPGGLAVLAILLVVAAAGHLSTTYRGKAG